jgi:P-type Cu+ transporter
MVVALVRKLAAPTVRNIKQNLFFAFAYYAIRIPVAAAMRLSSMSVIINALRLRRVDL